MSLATLVLATLLWSAIGCALAPVLGRLLRDAGQTLEEPADRLARRSAYQTPHERLRAPRARTRRSGSAPALGSSHCTACAARR